MEVSHKLKGTSSHNNPINKNTKYLFSLSTKYSKTLNSGLDKARLNKQDL